MNILQRRIDKYIDEDKYLRMFALICLVGFVILPYAVFTYDFWHH